MEGTRASAPQKQAKQRLPVAPWRHDKCGVFGIYAPTYDVARLSYFALYALQHRGQESAGLAVEQDGTDFHVVGQGGEKGAAREIDVFEKPEAEEKKIMVMVATDRLGRGDDELGAKLMVNFLKTLKEMGDELWRLVFVNNGVKLTIEDSPVLPDLKELEDNGINILVCGTCLDHFRFLDKKEVGETTNMLDIVTAMQLADKVINI